jgi:hypothetical protein
VDWSTRVLQQKPTWVPALRYRAAALAHLGHTEDARADITQLLAHQPACTLGWVTVYKFRHPWMQALFSEGLRLAGRTTSRRLATILAVNAVSFSSMMERDVSDQGRVNL